MARYHDIDAEIWEDLLDYSRDQKLLYIYLFSNSLCRPSGLFMIRLKTIKHHTDCSEEVIKSLCAKLIEYDFDTQEVFVRGKLKRFLSGFHNNDKVRKSVKFDYENLNSVDLKRSFYKKYEGALKGLVSPPLTLTLGLSLTKGEKPEKGECVQGAAPRPVKAVSAGHELNGFDLFWKVYPKKRSKGQAEKAWDKINPDAQLKTMIIVAIERAKKTKEWKEQNWKFVPYPATWLNARGWEDVIPECDTVQTETPTRNLQNGEVEVGEFEYPSDCQNLVRQTVASIGAKNGK